MPARLLESFRSQGISFRAAHDGLKFRSDRKVPADVRASIRTHRWKLLDELQKEAAEAIRTCKTGPLAADILETRSPGVFLLRTPHYDLDVWMALGSRDADELRAEEAKRDDPRPVLDARDIKALEGKSGTAIRCVLDFYTVFHEGWIEQ